MMYAFPLQVLITVVDRGKGDKMARLYERVWHGKVRDFRIFGPG